MIDNQSFGMTVEDLRVRIPIVISTRNVHLTASVIEQLFCDHDRLHLDAAPNEAHHFVALDSVTLVGPHGRLRNVRIIGPPQKVNQVEISRTDAEILGVKAPLRRSGDLIGTPGITLKGPRIQVTLETGVICVQRHVHMSPSQAKQFGFKDGDCVSVSIKGVNRALQFREVPVCISDDDHLELHLDTDDANLAGVKSGNYALMETATRAGRR